MEGNFMLLVWLLLVAAALIWGFYWEERRSHQILRDWAAREGVTLLTTERANSRREPGITASASQALFHVTVQDGHGLTRRARVVCGSPWLGMVRNVAQASWE
jgi:hypothetical protein